MKKSTLIKIELARPTPQAPALKPKDSWLFSSITVYRADHIIGFAVDGFPKAPDYAQIFPGLKPRANGFYELELGATLPEMLPNLDGKQDYSLRITTKHSTSRVQISNRMRRVDFMLDGVQHFAVLPVHGEKSLRANIAAIPDSAPMIQVNSTAIIRFKISGASAEDALERHVEACINQFVLCLNKLLTTCYSFEENDFGYFSLQYSQTSFPWFYVMMKGGDRKLIDHDRIASHAGRVALTTQNFSKDKTRMLERLLLASTERLDPRRFLSSAKMASILGLDQLALLQSVIASEMATAHFVKERLRDAGISKKKWDQHKNDLRYSQMLDLYLPALTPRSKKPSSEVVGLLNRARTLRNSLMHEGNEAITEGELSRLIQATSLHLDYLANVGKPQTRSKRKAAVPARKTESPTESTTGGNSKRRKSTALAEKKSSKQGSPSRPKTR